MTNRVDHADGVRGEFDAHDRLAVMAAFEANDATMRPDDRVTTTTARALAPSALTPAIVARLSSP